MKEQIEERLRMLREEYKAGQEILVDLDQKQLNVRNTLVRISGAIQVLEELLKQDSAPALDAETPATAAVA